MWVTVAKIEDKPPSWESHRFGTLRGLPWQVCLHCGLVALRNDFTRWCIAHTCDYRHHPGYARAKAS